MVSSYRFACYLLLALLISILLQPATAWADTLEAQVDRNRLTENESLLLSLRAPGLQLTGEPDLSELYQDFEVISQQVRTNLQIINGENRSERVWEITLLPKRSGTLIIPAIPFGDTQSQPITLEVRPKPANTQASADVFLHSEIDHRDSIYVQQQLIYTLRLYYATSISDHGLTDLALENVLMVPLGNRKDFEARIDGRTYNVAEWQFALYPQSSGELVLPPQTFSGRIRIQNRYSLGGLKHVRIESPEHRIQVKPVPEAFPKSAQWLPAQSLRLSQQWGSDFSQWQQGSPMTRTLSLQAQGLTAAQLPPIVMAEREGLRQYPEQPQLKDLPQNLNQKGAGITGEKDLSIALIPTQPGALSLPQVRIPWWSTETDQLEYATLDALSLDILPDPNQPAKAEPLTRTPEKAETQIVVERHTPLYWPVATLVLALISLGFAFLLWRDRLQLQAFNKQLMHAAPSPASLAATQRKENPIFRQALLNACRQNQARAAWDAWQKWQQYEAPETSPEFEQALHQLQRTLFGPDAAPQDWDGSVMAQASKVVQLPGAQAKPQLPDLYPS